VRVADPASLANWLLGPDQANWSEERRARIMASERQTRLIMKTPVPVYLAYVTAWLSQNQLPAFRPDIYDLDGELIKAIDDVSSKPRRMVATMARANAGTQIDPTVNDGPVQVAAP